MFPIVHGKISSSVPLTLNSGRPKRLGPRKVFLPKKSVKSQRALIFYVPNQFDDFFLAPIETRFFSMLKRKEIFCECDVKKVVKCNVVML